MEYPAVSGMMSFNVVFICVTPLFYNKHYGNFVTAAGVVDNDHLEGMCPFEEEDWALCCAQIKCYISLILDFVAIREWEYSGEYVYRSR